MDGSVEFEIKDGKVDENEIGTQEILVWLNFISYYRDERVKMLVNACLRNLNKKG